ncbi:MAG: hypothetical protein KY453_07440 [Gemmatimonadetes bacterium]|nr:hypothetical protein [Gemmatimonadota bacterium]
MRSSRWRGARGRRAFHALAVGAFSLAALASAPRPVSGQTSDGLVERELEYRAARSDVQAAQDARSVVERRFSEALDEVSRARRSGDGGRLEAALARAQSLSLELSRADERVRTQEGELAATRDALLATLDGRRRRLEARLADAGPGERFELDALIRDLANQYRQVEQAETDVLEIELVYFPSITFDPRDGPVELAAKADLLDRKAEQADSTLASIDREIERLESLLRLQRSRQSFQGNLERFGDTQVPVGAPTRRGTRDAEAGRSPTDSTGVPGLEEPLEDRIQSLRLFRFQVEDARDQFLSRAGTFRRLLTRSGA